MNCDQIERDEIIENYLTGRLDRVAQEEFEAHWFGCRECSRKLQVSRMLQEKLWEKGDRILPPRQKPARVRVPGGRRAWAYSAAAAVLIIAAAAVLWWQFRGPGRPHAQGDRPHRPEAPGEMIGEAVGKPEEYYLSLT
jgi:ferric-dicitrate binding protein FerR (iron transport regulator)